MAAFQVAQAQAVRGCPEGQAVQSLHPTGFRTFRADGTGTLELEAINLNYPGVAYTRIQKGSFRREIVDGKLIIDDNAGGDLSGKITAGGTRVNWIVSIEDLPRQVGVCSARTSRRSRSPTKVRAWRRAC
jgi:hypothetical protein